MLRVAMPLASVSTETWAQPMGEELKLAARARPRLRLSVNLLLQLREDMLSSLKGFGYVQTIWVALLVPLFWFHYGWSL